MPAAEGLYNKFVSTDLSKNRRKEMSEQNDRNFAINPYLPGWEYVPDGEPHVFGDRIYIFGSHDRAEGTEFCQEDYTIWSAPVDNLADWTCHGISYRKDQDPHNKQMKTLWAPDVCRGADGRYYLYYCCAFVPEVGIAVADRPEGPYEFYDYVRDENGEIWSKDLPFDPGVLYEDPDHIWLYIGFGPMPAELPENLTADMLRTIPQFKDESEEKLEGMLKQVELMRNPSHGSTCLHLAPDMKTVLSSRLIVPARKYAAGTTFEEHPFFEASSMRKINGRYYFIYSSFAGHELCYATSDYPDRDFTYGGVIISNADLGLNGNKIPRAFYANNHGSLEKIRNQWYIFYHRHTNLTTYSRQGCAEPVTILPDGEIPQAEITSQGLNGAPIDASKELPAYALCNLQGPEGACLLSDPATKIPDNAPYITETAEEASAHEDPYLVNMQTGASCGFKYLKFNGQKEAVLTVAADQSPSSSTAPTERQLPKQPLSTQIHGRRSRQRSSPCLKPMPCFSGLTIQVSPLPLNPYFSGNHCCC
jgi:arabinoxylan arabinofuranohydrolase